MYGYGATAEGADADLETKLAGSRTWTPNAEATLREFAVGIWRPSIARLEESSVKRYTSTWRKFLDRQLGAVPLPDLSRIRLDGWLQTLHAEGVPAPSARYAASVLSNILRMAVDYDLIPRNPASSLRLPRKAPKRERVLSPDQALDLLSRAGESPLSCPVFLAAVLGLRRGEIAGIRWDDLDRQRGELRIRRQRRASKGRGIIEKGLKTASSARTLRLTPALIAEIDGRGDLDHPYICTKNERPWRPDELTREWTQARESFGLPTWTFHDLRHGAAGLLYAAGADLLEIAAVLGHSRPDMSWMYTSAGEQRAAGALADLAGALGFVDKP